MALDVNPEVVKEVWERDIKEAGIEPRTGPEEAIRFLQNADVCNSELFCATFGREGTEKLAQMMWDDAARGVSLKERQRLFSDRAERLWAELVAPEIEEVTKIEAEVRALVESGRIKPDDDRAVERAFEERGFARRAPRLFGWFKIVKSHYSSIRAKYSCKRGKRWTWRGLATAGQVANTQFTLYVMSFPIASATNVSHASQVLSTRGIGCFIPTHADVLYTGLNRPPLMTTPTNHGGTFKAKATVLFDNLPANQGSTVGYASDAGIVNSHNLPF